MLGGSDPSGSAELGSLIAQNAGLEGGFPGVWWGAQTPCFIVLRVSNPSDSAELVPLMLEMRVWRPFSG